jgi:hypothetical protein
MARDLAPARAAIQGKIYMGKKTIIAIVILLAVAVGIRYLSDRKSGAAAEAGAAVSAALKSVERNGAPQIGASSSNSSSWGPAAAAMFPKYDKDPNADTGILEGTSVKDILDEYGKVWGRNVKNPIIKEGEAEELMTMLQDYFVCRSIVMDDTAECSPLPENATEPQQNVRTRCAFKSDTMLIAAYMAGRHSSFKSCARFCKWVEARDIQDNPQKHCPNFAKGLEHFCDTAPADRLVECRGAYPVKRSDCDIPRKPGDTNPDTCPDRFDLYAAMKSGNLSLCPARYKAACEAFASRDMAVCSTLALKASLAYGVHKDRMRIEGTQTKPDLKRLQLKPGAPPAPAAPELQKQQKN